MTLKNRTEVIENWSSLLTPLCRCLNGLLQCIEWPYQFIVWLY